MIAPVRRFLMRVCMEPRLLPGVRWSTLKMVNSWPSCWMTMPGRSCVALTLLICSLESLLISEIQAGQGHGRIRNDSRYAGRNFMPSAKLKYKWPDSTRSIRILCHSVCQPDNELFSPDCSEALALSGDRHSGIVNMDQAPAALFSLIDLCFPAVGGERGAISSELGGEIPIELGPGCIPVNMNGNVVDTQFALRKGFAHQTGVDILLNLFETVFVAQRVDKRNVR